MQEPADSGTSSEESVDESLSLDVALKETKKILLDLIELSSSTPALADQKRALPTVTR